MATYTLVAAMPEAFYPGGTEFTFEARDPTSASAVSGVKVSDIAIYGYTGGEAGVTSDTPLYSPATLDEDGIGV